MTEASRRKFKLDLSILDDPEFTGAHAAIALMAGEDGVPVVKVVAGGFPPSDEGAGELSDMLRDTADAIDDHLARPRPHTDTDTLDTMPQRPRFNPQPRGPKQ